jgi:hypothetical protein
VHSNMMRSAFEPPENRGVDENSHDFTPVLGKNVMTVEHHTDR